MISGLSVESWTNRAACAWCFGRNLRPDPEDGISPYQRKHGIAFAGRRIPFGAIVDLQPQPDIFKTRDDFLPRRIPGIFVGYHVQPGNEWSGDYLVCDLDSFVGPNGSIDATPRQARVQRIKEVSVRTRAPKFPIRSVT